MTNLDFSKLKAFADNKLKVIQIAKFVLDKIENIVGKEENAGYLSIFFFSQNVFKRLFLHGHYKSGLCGKELIISQTTNFRSFQTERVCRRHFKFDENGRKTANG